MITWIQTILQKHHKYVFSILLVVIIIAFVFTIGSSIPFFGDRNPEYETNKQDFYGWNLRDQNVVQELYTSMYYDSLLTGMSPRTEAEAQSLMLTRALLLSMANKMNLPTVSDAEFVAFLQAQPAFLNSDGTFSQDKLNLFVSQHSAMGAERLDSILLSCAMVSKMRDLLAGTGFVQDMQVDTLYKMQNSKYTFSIASLDLANFNPEIAVDEAKIETFYDNNKISYEVAKEISLKVAFFPISDFANAEISATDEQLESFYYAQRALFMVEKDGKQSLEPFESAKAKVEVAYKKAQILRMATEKAQEFSDVLYGAATTYNSDAFKAILAEAKVDLKAVPSYSANATMEQLPKDYPVDVLRAGFGLDEANWLYNDIVVSEEGAYVVLLDSIRPAYIPSLTDIRIQIERDFKAAETYALFSAKANALEASLTEALKADKSFAETAKKEGAIVQDFADFSFVKPEQAQIQAMGDAISLIQEIMYLKADEMSKMSLLDGKAYVFFMSKLETPAIDKDSQEYKNFAENLSINAAAQSEMSFINEKISAFMTAQ